MAIRVDYKTINECLTRIEQQISNLELVFSEEFTVTSLKGDTGPMLQNALQKLQDSLHKLEQEPLAKMKQSVENVHKNYTAKEQAIQSGL